MSRNQRKNYNTTPEILNGFKHQFLVPWQATGRIIGRNGSKIENICHKFHVQIDVPKHFEENTDEQKMLTITGDNDVDVFGAKDAVIKIVNSVKSQLEEHHLYNPLPNSMRLLNESFRYHQEDLDNPQTAELRALKEKNKQLEEKLDFELYDQHRKSIERAKPYHGLPEISVPAKMEMDAIEPVLKYMFNFTNIDDYLVPLDDARAILAHCKEDEFQKAEHLIRLRFPTWNGRLMALPRTTYDSHMRKKKVKTLPKPPKNLYFDFNKSSTTTLLLHLTPGHNGNSELINYRCFVEHRESGTWINDEKLFSINIECPEMILEIDELKPNTTYRCRLKTVTLFGESSFSEWSPLIKTRDYSFDQYLGRKQFPNHMNVCPYCMSEMGYMKNNNVRSVHMNRCKKKLKKIMSVEKMSYEEALKKMRKNKKSKSSKSSTSSQKHEVIDRIIFEVFL